MRGEALSVDKPACKGELLETRRIGDHNESSSSNICKRGLWYHPTMRLHPHVNQAAMYNVPHISLQTNVLLQSHTTHNVYAYSQNNCQGSWLNQAA